jgi:hypothetical protein
MVKTAKRDAQRLANEFYNQVELHAQVADKKQQVHMALPVSPMARELHHLVHTDLVFLVVPPGRCIRYHRWSST